MPEYAGLSVLFSFALGLRGSTESPSLSRARAVVLECIEGGARVIIDCGAFTAFTTGSEIGLDEYCEYLDTLPEAPNLEVMALDVIGQPGPTIANLRAMRRRGYRPMPIWQPGMDVDQCRELLDGTDRLAVGGLVGSQRRWLGETRRIQQWAGDARLHLLGVARPGLLKAIRPASVDSSAWNGPVRFGHTAVYAGGGRFLRFARRDVGRRGGAWGVIAQELRARRFPPEAMLRGSAWSGAGSGVSVVSALAYIELMIDIRKELGVDLHLATVLTYQTKRWLDLKLAWEWHQYLTQGKERPLWLMNPVPVR